MTEVDAAISASLHDLVLETDGDLTRLHGTMVFAKELEGPPGRVHGGIHPLVRTLPVLERIRGTRAPVTRVKIDAALQKGLPLEQPVPFDGTYRATTAGYSLTTRFLGTDRLLASACDPSPGDLPSGDRLARFRELFETSDREESVAMKVIGVPYRVSPSAVRLGIPTLDAAETGSHLHRCLHRDGSVGLAALCTQLDAVGASGRGVQMRHPHFTKHISLAFDAEGLTAKSPIVILADRTNIVEDDAPDAPKVDIRGTRYGTARVEVIAADPDFTRCYAHGFVTAHPVDAARFEGFEAMRKLREL